MRGPPLGSPTRRVCSLRTKFGSHRGDIDAASADDDSADMQVSQPRNPQQTTRHIHTPKRPAPRSLTLRLRRSVQHVQLPIAMTAEEAERVAASEGLALQPSNTGPNHPRYLGVSAHADTVTNEVFFCASVVQNGQTVYLQDAVGNIKFTSDAEAALTFARYTAGRQHQQQETVANAQPTVSVALPAPGGGARLGGRVGTWLRGSCPCPAPPGP